MESCILHSKITKNLNFEIHPLQRALGPWSRQGVKLLEGKILLSQNKLRNDEQKEAGLF